MSLQDFKIKEADVIAVYVQKQPDILTGSPNENKKVFDDYPSMIKEKFNALINGIDRELSSTNANIESTETLLQTQIDNLNSEVGDITLATTNDILGLFK